MEPTNSTEKRPCKKICCGDVVLGVLFVLLAFTVGIIVGAVFAGIILGSLAAIIVLAIVLAILILIRLIVIFCNKKMNC